MKKIYMVILTMTLGLGIVLGSVPCVWAQESDIDEYTLDEITVTAQKREENQQKVPIAMEVISGDELKELGNRDVEDILRFISNAIINTAADGMRVSLRGIADDSSLFNNLHVSTPTVGVNKDGVYSSRSDSGQGLYDIERVEVLLGPQSTLYANNSPGGIVNIVTASPKTDRFEVSGTLEYGTYDYLHTEGSMNAPLSDTMALRAAFSTAARDGYISNGTDDEDSKSARVKFLVQPNEKFSITVTGEYTTSGGLGRGNVDAFDNQDDVDDPWTSSAEAGSGSSKYAESITGNIEWSLGLADITIIPSYSTNEKSEQTSMTDMMTGETSLRNMENSMWQKGAEMRVGSPSDSSFKWLLGANYYDSWDTMAMHQVGETYSQANDAANKSHAFYGNITYPVTDLLRVTAGLRKSWDTVTNNSAEYNKPREDGTTEDMITYSVNEYSSPDYKLGIEYDLGPEAMLYADWSTSYRMQGMAMPDAEGNYPPPEEMTAYTLGSKNQFLDNKLQVNIASFYYYYKNKKATQMKNETVYEDDPRVMMDLNRDGLIEHVTGALHDANSQTYGDFRSVGIDVSTSWIVTAKDRLDFSISYLNAKWDYLVFDFEYDLVYPMEIYTGQTNTLSPEYTVSATYSHDFHMQNGAVVTARFDSRYQSDYIVEWNPAYDDYRFQEANHISNFSVIYANPDGKWTLTGYMKNIENYATKRSFMMENLTIGPPRTYGAVLSVKY